MYDLDFIDRLVAVLKQIEATPVPVIAALNGTALGAGLNLRWSPTCASWRRGVGWASWRPIGVAVDEWTIRRLASLVGDGHARAS